MFGQQHELIQNPIFAVSLNTLILVVILIILVSVFWSSSKSSSLYSPQVGSSVPIGPIGSKENALLFLHNLSSVITSNNIDVDGSIITYGSGPRQHDAARDHPDERGSHTCGDWFARPWLPRRDG